MNFIHSLRDASAPTRPEPLLGWRLWRVRGASLQSWSARHTWEPGENAASCLAPDACPHPPGRACMCGFWALFSPLQTVALARLERVEHASALGLIRAWGEIAVHGHEGFRAERATVACLFTDGPWDATVLPCPAGGWWERLAWRVRRPLQRLRPRPPRDHSFGDQLAGLAQDYGVPLLSMDDAARHGLLTELGATPRMLEESRRWGGAVASESGAAAPPGL